MSANYDSDDALRKSPGLEPFRPRATPSVSPPPIVTHHVPLCTTIQNVSPSSSRRRKKSNRRKTRPSQGDFVLIRVMDPNQPDIARQVGERALNSESGSEMEDEEMENRSPIEVASADHANHPRSDGASLDLSRVAQRALSVDATTQHTFAKPPPPLHRDSVVEPDGHDALRKASFASQATDTSGNGSLLSVSDALARTRTLSVSATSASSREERNGSIANGHADSGSSGRTPDLHDLAIPSRSGSPSQKLPALQTPQSPPQNGAAASPNTQKQQLPGFRHLSDLAETAIQEQETRNNSIAHRQSISSTGQSPTSVGRQLSVTSLSPNSTYGPHSAASPNGDPQSQFQTRDPFLRSGHGHLTLFANTRRPSQASDSGPYSATTLHSATTENSYSSEGVSPGAQVTPIEMRGGPGGRLSIDGALASRTLPPPPGVGANIGLVPSHGSGGFKCDHPGCTALPFQTQYLLKYFPLSSSSLLPSPPMLMLNKAPTQTSTRSPAHTTAP
ncbi:uncharacterized protein N0V89_003332 [Didymosphaeria variabile]|uniref:Uncharacterized protein n=1 Tax=Didymosphaeria variabile TaxID=1932322 RepID=A0A9W9CFF9_9PLEO|nr:uncharacterized protein N0V89_003332 [Didymosphaeria variabile]KAJ4358748.1 hypothetical protein N0V89_003332 [Didymosphaeria variabile]